MGSQTGQKAYTAMRSQPPDTEPAGMLRPSHAQKQQQQQQPHRPPPGPRLTSTPTLASQTEISPQNAERSTSGLPASLAQEGGSAGWGNATQKRPHQSGYSSQQVPSQSSNLSQGILGQISNFSQGSLEQGSGNRQFMPIQTSIPFQDRSLSQQPSTAHQEPQATASRTVQFSDFPLLGPSTSKASQPAHNMGADTGVGQSGWGAYQEAQPLQAEQMSAALTSRTTQDADAGPISHSQARLPKSISVLCSHRVHAKQILQSCEASS